MRVVVVGAGLAGLHATEQLRAAGCDVQLIEGGHRPGGRVRTVRAPFAGGQYAESGAEWVDTIHPRMLALLDRFGLEWLGPGEQWTTIRRWIHHRGQMLDPRQVRLAAPAVYDQLMERLAEGGTGSPAQRFDVDFKLGYSPTDASLSYLRAAYLVVFARYGYSAVLSDAFRPLRRALKTLDPDVLPNAPTLTRVPGYAQTWFSGEHDELGSVLVVAFEQCVIVLQNPLEHDESWWQIAPTPQSSFDLKRLIPWPTRPEHLLDLERPKVAVPGETEVMDLFGD